MRDAEWRECHTFGPRSTGPTGTFMLSVLQNWGLDGSEMWTLQCPRERRESAEVGTTYRKEHGSEGNSKGTASWQQDSLRRQSPLTLPG